jgi:hypothetical protein
MALPPSFYSRPTCCITGLPIFPENAVLIAAYQVPRPIQMELHKKKRYYPMEYWENKFDNLQKYAYAVRENFTKKHQLLAQFEEKRFEAKLDDRLDRIKHKLFRYSAEYRLLDSVHLIACMGADVTQYRDGAGLCHVVMHRWVFEALHPAPNEHIDFLIQHEPMMHGLMMNTVCKKLCKYRRAWSPFIASSWRGYGNFAPEVYAVEKGASEIFNQPMLIAPISKYTF